MNKQKIIERISEARTNAKLSARELSQMIGMNCNYINRLENKGEFAPSLDVLLNIIEACNLTTEQFFYYDLQAYAKDLEIIKLLKTTSNDRKNAVITLLQKDN